MRHAICFIVLLYPITLFSQVVGHDLLALQQQNFREEVAAAELPKGVAIGVLDTTFGSSFAPLRTVLTRVQPRYLRFHLIDGTCIRNRVCERGLVQSGYTTKTFDQAIRNGNAQIKAHLQKRTLAFRELAKEFPGTKFIGSPVLEHDLSVQSFRIVTDWMLSVWPELQISNSANGGVTQERYRGAWIERHGPSAPVSGTDIVSTDGVDITDIDSSGFLHRYSQSKIVFLWTRSYNCRHQGENFVMPKARNSCTTRQIFQVLAHIVENLGAPPRFAGKQCRTLREFKSPQIWKPLAEDKGNGDQRANYPVLISAFNSTAPVNVLDQSGTKIGSVGYYGGFNNGLNRYYSRYPGGSGNGAYGFQEKSKGFSWLQQGGSCFGPLILGRRQGDFR